MTSALPAVVAVGSQRAEIELRAWATVVAGAIAGEWALVRAARARRLGRWLTAGRWGFAIARTTVVAVGSEGAEIELGAWSAVIASAIASEFALVRATRARRVGRRGLARRRSVTGGRPAIVRRCQHAIAGRHSGIGRRRIVIRRTGTWRRATAPETSLSGGGQQAGFLGRLERAIAFRRNDGAIDAFPVAAHAGVVLIDHGPGAGWERRDAPRGHSLPQAIVKAAFR
jgi:hypothetical protein